jgi:large subunit ribosomal protein L19
MPIVKHVQDSQLKTLPAFRVGHTIKVHQKIREGGKERIQIFEGLVIARKGGLGVNATFMVRKVSGGVGVEKIFPLHSPNIEKVEITKAPIVRQAKLYYVRKRQDNSPRTRKEPLKKREKK